MNRQENNHQQAVEADVFSRFGIDHLRGHANATPERLAYITREAPSKRSPSGWAAACILKGYAVPPLTKADAEARRRSETEDRLARYDAMPETQRALILARARAQYPNLNPYPDDHPAVRGGISILLAAHEGSATPGKDAS